MTPEQHHLGQLNRMLEFEQMVADRVGTPGCAARLKAADNVLALTWAIEMLRGPQEAFNRLRSPEPLTMDDARRNAGKGNLSPPERPDVEFIMTSGKNTYRNVTSIVSDGVRYFWRDGKLVPEATPA